MSDNFLNFQAIREKLSKLNGANFWRSMDEVAETPEFKKFLENEYPYEAADFSTPMERRHFLKVMGASLLMSGLAGCKPQPLEKIVPYVKAPEEIVPGKPLFFATAMPLHGQTIGLLVESHMGRPTKVEGNPQHPDSLGATHAFAQASVLGLYDPDRAKALKHSGFVKTWRVFTETIAAEMEKQTIKEGSGIRILTEAVLSPTLAAQIQELLKKYPKAKWYQYEPAHSDAQLEASQIAFGEYVTPRYDFKKADVVVSFNADFMNSMPQSLKHARHFMSRRNPENKNVALNRLYAIESTPTPSGSLADHRLVLKPALLNAFIVELAKHLGVKTQSAGSAKLNAEQQKWIKELADDLMKHRGKSIVIGDLQLPAGIQVLLHAINQVLGNAGATVTYTENAEMVPASHTAAIKDLVKELNEDQVDILVTLGGNPVYNAPADLNFANAYKKAKQRIRLGLHEDETSRLSHWNIPEAHYLEAFSDVRATGGTLSLVQPLIEPLYGGKSAHEVISALNGEGHKKGYDIVKSHWKKAWPELNFEKKWRKALHDGLVANSAFAAKNVTAKTSVDGKHFKGLLDDNGLEILFRADPTIGDGRFANNGWLQELPKPLSLLTWDNALIISPRTAEKHQLQSDDMVELVIDGKKLEAPVWVMPGQADDTLTFYLGYGRENAGQVGNGAGFNAYAVRSSSAMNHAAAKIYKTGKKYKLASTQQHYSMEGRNLIRKASAEEFHANPHFAEDHHHGPPGHLETNIYPKHNYDGYAWGMAINLNACMGCNACVVACQSENNIPVVGKEEVIKGREMQWIRIDRYYEGDLDNPEIHHQPVMCMHCENAPCEPVCPVGATVHSNEGLNEMVYNRCVGTRYCANNCPYKVRKFNFLEYVDNNTESLKLQRNPDVTVRARGVMEKCTFCVQRINSARANAKKDNRSIQDGEIKTACQSSCPTEAITFGDINDKNSSVAKQKSSPLNYGLLTELNTFPRVTYLAKVVNPNPHLITHTNKTVQHGH